MMLAYMLDSLVRVSRRVDWNHFVNILSITKKINCDNIPTQWRTAITGILADPQREPKRPSFPSKDPNQWEQGAQKRSKL
jgi:hypothetical protein